MSAYEMTPEDDNLEKLLASERRRQRHSYADKWENIQTIRYEDKPILNWKLDQLTLNRVDVIHEALRIIGLYRQEQTRTVKGEYKPRKN